MLRPVSCCVEGAGGLFCQATVRNSERLVFYRLSSVTAIHYIPPSGRSALWVSCDSARALKALSSIRRTFWTAEKIVMPRLIERRKQSRFRRSGADFLTCGKWSVAILSGSYEQTVSERPQTVDYLYLSSSYRGSLSSALCCYVPQTVVLDASLPKERCEALKCQAEVLSVPVYDMRFSGALLVRK